MTEFRGESPSAKGQHEGSMSSAHTQKVCLVKTKNAFPTVCAFGAPRKRDASKAGAAFTPLARGQAEPTKAFDLDIYNESENDAMAEEQEESALDSPPPSEVSNIITAIVCWCQQMDDKWM